jgi:hypothetical protein
MPLVCLRRPLKLIEKQARAADSDQAALIVVRSQDERLASQRKPSLAAGTGTMPDHGVGRHWYSFNELKFIFRELAIHANCETSECAIPQRREPCSGVLRDQPKPEHQQ